MPANVYDFRTGQNCRDYSEVMEIIRHLVGEERGGKLAKVSATLKIFFTQAPQIFAVEQGIRVVRSLFRPFGQFCFEPEHNGIDAGQFPLRPPRTNGLRVSARLELNPNAAGPE